MWITSFIILLFDGDHITEIFASNIYALVLVAFFQQIMAIIPGSRK
jgi:hypothetical protein